MVRTLGFASLVLVVAGLTSCAPRPAKTGDAADDAQLTDVQKIARACATAPGEADGYHTAKALVAHLAGRWAACSPGANFGMEYTADGRWTRLTYEADKGWQPIHERAEDDAGVYKIFTTSHRKVELDDDRTSADDFLVLYNVARPPSIWGFEKSPKRAISINYGNPIRWVPIP